jgi:hypothetical protein
MVFCGCLWSNTLEISLEEYIIFHLDGPSRNVSLLLIRKMILI